LNQNITLKRRKELEDKMAKVFKENIDVLSTELQENIGRRHGHGFPK